MNCIKLFVLTICFLGVPILADINFNGGEIYNIDYEIREVANIGKNNFSEESPTTINFLPNSLCYHLNIYNYSVVNMSGGKIEVVYPQGDCEFYFDGGIVNASIFAYENSYLSFTGGIVNENQLYLGDNVRLDFFDGYVSREIIASENSKIDFYGGSFGGELRAEDTAKITIYGNNFCVDGVSVGYMSLATVLGGESWDEPIRHLTGYLDDGSFIDNDFRIGENASIVLIPEPCTLLVLGLGSLLMRRK